MRFNLSQHSQLQIPEMNFQATLFRENFSPILQCSSCCNFRLHSFKASSIVSILKCSPRSSLKKNSVSRLACQGKQRIVVCRATETEAEPESDNDKEKEILEDGIIAPYSDSPVQNNGELNPQPAFIDQEKEILEDGNLTPSSDSLVQNNEKLNSQPADTDQDNDKSVGMDNDKSLGMGMLDLNNSTENSDGELKPQGDIQENLEVASGSPLPGLKQLGEPIRIPKETIDVLKDQVFGFDTFFVTSQEPYEGGVLFKGNLRGKAAKSFEKIKKRLEAKFEDQYLVFLLTNPEDDKPVAVVVPKRTMEPEKTAIPEWVAAGTFGVVTIFTLLLRNVPELQSTLLSSFDNIGLLKDGLSGALVTALILGVHELGHNLVASSSGIKLAVPYFVPSWQIGSYGAITRIINIVPNREDLLKFAAAGPVAGFSLGFILLLLGFFIPPSDGIGVIVDSSVFHESFLAGGIAKLLLGDVLKEGSPVSVNPIVIRAWAGLLINAINSIPAGELDGGRIALALWGRKASARLTSAAIVLLGLSSLFNDVAFYWVVLIFFLQRGPIAPLSEEITDPENKYVALGVTVLILGLLVFLPYPFPFTNEAMLTSF